MKHQPSTTPQAHAHPQSAGRVVRAGEGRPTLHPLFSPSRVMSTAAEEARLAREEAARILSQAQREAQQLLDDAAQRAQEMLATATTEAGEKSARSIERLLATLEAQAETDHRRRAQTLAETSLRIARAILDAEFSLRPERLADLLSALLARVGDEPRVTVALHPEDAEILERHGVSIGTRAGYHGTLVIVPDPDLPRASIHLATSVGAYDASLSTQFSRVREALLAEFDTARQDPSAPTREAAP